MHSWYSRQLYEDKGRHVAPASSGLGAGKDHSNQYGFSLSGFSAPSKTRSAAMICKNAKFKLN